jgi:formamidopyrimidine-DNA glycosylase
MIEMPEAYVISHQMHETLAGKTIQRFARGPLVHKFLWLNRQEEETQALLAGQVINSASSYGRSMYIRVGEAYMLWLGEMGGRWLYHPAGQAEPEKCHVRMEFTDGSALTYLMQMWGFINVLEKADFGERPYKEVGIPPLSEAFTFERLDQLLEAYPDKNKKGIKGFLVTSVHVNGIGNSYLQDILFQARLHPARKIPGLAPEERCRCM